MPAPAAMLDLVARFGEHIDACKFSTYNETQLRRDFLEVYAPYGLTEDEIKLAEATA